MLYFFAIFFQTERRAIRRHGVMGEIAGDNLMLG
jgi:hypothetical protein